MTKTDTTSVDDFIGAPEAEESTQATQVAQDSQAADAVVEKPKKAEKEEAAVEKAAAKSTKAEDEIPVEPIKARTVTSTTTRTSVRPSSRPVSRPMVRTNTRPTNNRSVSQSSGRSSMMRTNTRSTNSYSTRNMNPRMQQQMDMDEVDFTSSGDIDVPVQTIKGILDDSRDGHGVLRAAFSPSDNDAYISTSQIRRFNLRPGDMVEGPARQPKENERYWGLLKVEVVNGVPTADVGNRVKFQSLTPVYPDSQLKLENGEEPLSTRIIDLIAPIGKGQRSLIVSPPKAGKTTLLKDIATGIANNHPEIHVMAVLVGERPEEVTDIRRHIAKITKEKGEVAASNFDEAAEEQCAVAELALERAKRLVEMGQDVVILLDSITRLARAYNLAMPTSGRTLSGGFDPAALFPPKKFFGAARNFEVKGSLTIIGTALIETGSRMDDLIYEEFKGTGNQEVHLDRRLAERRIYPAIDVQRSGTRRDDLLMDSITYQTIQTLHRMLDTLDKEERTQTLTDQMKRFKTNKEFLISLKAG